MSCTLTGFGGKKINVKNSRQKFLYLGYKHEKDLLWKILQKNSGNIVLILYTNIPDNDRLFLEYSCLFSGIFRKCPGIFLIIFYTKIFFYVLLRNKLTIFIRQSQIWCNLWHRVINGFFSQNLIFGKNELIIEFKDYLDIKRKKKAGAVMTQLDDHI